MRIKSMVPGFWFASSGLRQVEQTATTTWHRGRDKTVPVTNFHPRMLSSVLGSSIMVCIVSFSDQLKRSEEEKLALETKVQQLQSKYPFQILKVAQGLQYAWCSCSSKDIEGLGPSLASPLLCTFSDSLLVKWGHLHGSSQVIYQPLPFSFSSPFLLHQWRPPAFPQNCRSFKVLGFSKAPYIF